MKSGRLVLAIRQEFQEGLDIEVGDSNVSYKSIIYELLHFRPCLMDRGTLEFKLIGTRLVPSGGIGSLERNEFQRDRD